MTTMCLKNFAAVALCVGLACASFAQDAPAPKPADQPQATTPAAAPAAPAAPADAPTALPTPSITGPLAASPPIILEAGPLGKLSLNGIVSGFGVFQSLSLIHISEPTR